MITFLSAHPSTHRKQSGAALVVSLIFLLIMTILALSMSQTTTLEERMAGNARDSNAAFQGAETAQWSGQRFVRNSNSINSPSIDNSGVDPTTLSGTAANNWWIGAGIEYGIAGTKDLTKLSSDPRYVVRKRAQVSRSMDPTSGDATIYYEVLGRSRGTTPDSEAITSKIVGIPNY